MPSPPLGEDFSLLPLWPQSLASFPLGQGTVPLCRTDRRMTIPGRIGPELVRPRLPKSPTATFMLTAALGGRLRVHSTDRQTEAWHPEKAQEESGEQKHLEKMELRGQVLQTLQGSGRALLWAGFFSPTTEAPGPGFFQLDPWKSPKQEPGEELLVIYSQPHLVCIPPAEP